MEGLKQRIKLTHKHHVCNLDMSRLHQQVNVRQPPNADWLKAKNLYVKAAEIASVGGQVIDLDQY
jgi:hypothetical protein